MNISGDPGDSAAFIKILEELEPCPVEKPSNGSPVVNEPIERTLAGRMRLSVTRGQPYGAERWTRSIAKRPGLESTQQDPWRPKNKTKKNEGEATGTAAYFDDGKTEDGKRVISRSRKNMAKCIDAPRLTRVEGG